MGQKRLAFAVVFSLVAAFFITAGPLSSVHPRHFTGFVPAYGAAMFGNNLLTAALLFAQLSILRSPPLLVISSGYLFTALILIPWMLTFPGVFAPQGLLGAGPQTTTWIYMLWHAGFALCVILYAFVKNRNKGDRTWRTSFYPGLAAGIGVVAIVCTVTFVVTADNAQLPILIIDGVHLSGIWKYVAGVPVLLSLIAIIALWIRQPSVLDLWLTVVMCAYVIEILLIGFPGAGRFSIGWYAGRVFGLLASSLVLIVLLSEMTTLYTRLLHAVLTQQREREARLMTGNAVAAMIAHEVKQPLAGMTTRAYAGHRWLDRAAPDLDEAKAAFVKISADGLRAGELIETIRAMFRGEPQNRTSCDVNDLINESLFFLRSDLQKHRITVEAGRNGPLPAVTGAPLQLRQVLINLMANAIDSMATLAGPRILKVRAELENGGVLVSVSDTGRGIKAEDVERVFDPLFTTKSRGMGMGLSICRSIIENHDSQLWVAPNSPRGAVFRFVLHPHSTSNTAADAERSRPDMNR
ncbi:MAG TPA: MASE4 domain-containing protein [Acidocella sp.]|nr:MASE4 domain-containing protein [Acidocella sp.]